jgi:hypothetical protein
MDTEDSLIFNQEYSSSMMHTKENITLQTCKPAKGTKLEEEGSTKGSNYRPIRSLVSRIKAISSGSKYQPGLLSRRASGSALSPLSSVPSTSDSDAERYERVQAPNENPEGYQQTSHTNDQEEANHFSMVFSNKSDFL